MPVLTNPEDQPGFTGDTITGNTKATDTTHVPHDTGTSTSTPMGATNDAKFLGLGGDPELWKVGDIYYIVYYAPGPFDPPVATLWSVPDDETLKAFGGGKIPPVDKVVTEQEIEETGSIIFGSTDEIEDAELDPWSGFKERMTRAALVQPWLSDPEVYAIIGAAYVEGRDLQDWELHNTAWWRDRNAGQRAWQEMYMSDRKTADQKIEGDKIQIRGMFESLGARGNDQALLDYMALQFTMGNWDEKKLSEQIEAVTSGWYDVDDGLAKFMETGGIAGVGSDDKTEEVRNMFLRWLGPAFPASDAQIREWATKFRNDPSAGEQLTASLRNQRKSLFPSYEDENLTYDDIASPWRGVMQQMWGGTADETSSTFQDIVRMNDLTEAQRLLRKVGMADGNETVMQSYAVGANKASGGSVRMAL